MGTISNWFTIIENLCQRSPRLCSYCHNNSSLLSSLETSLNRTPHRIEKRKQRIVWQVSLEESSEQYLILPPLFAGMGVVQSLDSYVVSFWTYCCSRLFLLFSCYKFESFQRFQSVFGFFLQRLCFKIQMIIQCKFSCFKMNGLYRITLW